MGRRILRASLATLAAVNWVDLLIIGLMLLAAVHGLRLGALVQILTFAGFWLGLLLGTVVWVPLRSTSTTPTRPGDHGRRLVLVTAGAVGRRRPDGRGLQQHDAAPSASWRRRCRTRGRSGGDRRPALVVARRQRDLVAEQPVHVARCRRGPLRHLAFGRSGPPPGATGVHRPAELPQRAGLPPGLLHPDPAVDGIGRHADDAATQSLAEPASRRRSRSSGPRAATSRRGPASWWATAWWRPTPMWWRARAPRRSSWADRPYGATVVLFDPKFDLAILRTEAPLGPVLTIDPDQVPQGHAGGDPGLPRGRPAHRRRRPASRQQITAVGRDIYNQGAVTRGVYALEATVRPGNSGGPVVDRRRGGRRRRLLALHRLPQRGLCLDLPGVLARVRQAAVAAGTGEHPEVRSAG